MVYPCSVSQETLRFDIYSPQSQNNDYLFTGTVLNRLNVISDPKLIKDFSKSAASSAPALLPTRTLSRRGVTAEKTPEVSPDRRDFSSLALYPKPDLSINSGSYAVNAADSSADIAVKFLHLLALGPISRDDIVSKLNSIRMVSDPELNSLISTHTQLYSAPNTFTESDIYPSIALLSVPTKEGNTLLILKDKAYKDLRPWAWTAYTPYERGLVIENAQNALTRLGFSETHPLRRKIIDKSAQTTSMTLKRVTGLGGGIILSGLKKGSAPSSPQPSSMPHRKAATESPSVDNDRKRYEARSGKSPLKEPTNKRRYEAVQTLCLSSSDDDKLSKKAKKDGHRSNSSASTNSNSSVGSLHSHHSSTSYTLGFSLNEEGPEEEGFVGTIKYPPVAKTSIQVPSRPSSALSTQEKKLQFYLHLAKKFRLRYREYELLHKQMGRSFAQNRGTDHKKNLMKLFELHNSLAEWKRKLWDYHNENNMAEGVMNLSKHRKLMSTSAIGGLAPPSSRIDSVERFPRENSIDRAATIARKTPPVSAVRAKMALNY